MHVQTRFEETFYVFAILFVVSGTFIGELFDSTLHSVGVALFVLGLLIFLAGALLTIRRKWRQSKTSTMHNLTERVWDSSSETFQTYCLTCKGSCKSLKAMEKSNGM